MRTADIFQTRSLCAQSFGGVGVVDALRWPTPFGTALRVCFVRGTPTDQLTGGAEASRQLQSFEMIAGNLTASGTAPEGQGAVLLQLGGTPIELQTASPENMLFDDLNVLMAMRHGETAEQVAQWLAYHVTHHCAEGLLLLDRAAPGPERAAFAAALQEALTGLDGLKRVILVTADLPLGMPETPPLGDPATAPRSKSTSAGQADAWRSPLAQLGVYDMLKWRFLTRAGAVVALDACDILRPPEDGIDAFEACRQSHTGVVQLQGDMLFPWRVRRGEVPALGDHICRAVPGNRAPNRWAIAPKRVGKDVTLSPMGVGGGTILADEVLLYDRAQSMVFPGSEIAELINKDLLELDKRLLIRAAEVFGHSPVNPPERKVLAKLTPQAPPTGRTLIVTCMKNEGPFILEWLAYHRMIGVDDFLVYTNDCDDGTDALLDALQACGIVQRRDNPFRETGGKPQQSALLAADDEALVQNAGWIISMDVDEFINVHVGGGRLPDLYDAVGEAGLISLTWRLFGNCDVDAFEDRPIVEQFTRCAPHLIRRPHQAWGFKTLFRNQGLFKGIGVHRPRGYLGGTPLWVNGSGQPMPARFYKEGWRSGVDSYGYDLVTLNHYAVRSVESFLVKRDRGRVNHVSRDQGEAYWFRMNNNDESDLSIQRHAFALEQGINDLKALPEIGALHEACVSAHRAKIAHLQAQPDYRALYETLSGERMKQLSRMHRHFGMNVFLHGPRVVPDRVFDPSLPPNFFFNTGPPDGRAAD